MSNSKLVTVKVPAYSGNYTKNRSLQWFDEGGYSKITMITIHHMASVSTAAQCGTVFQTPGRGGSSHYGVGNDGSVGLYVDESDVAWCNSNWYSNCHAVTIETSNCSLGGSYPVSDVAYGKLIQLVADIAKRNNLGKLVPGKNLTWHSMYAATACPGDYLRNRISDIASRANAINEDRKVPTANYLKIDGYNINRDTDQLIIYNTAGQSTGTNDWGYEVQVNLAGVAMTDPVYKGDHSIPKNGYVISGHGIAGEWIKNKIIKGTSLVLKNGSVYVNPLGYHKLAGVNTTRNTDYLVKYESPKTSTGTNKWGIEVPCDANRIMIEDPTQSVGNMQVPEGGSVISGVNVSASWLINAAKSGYRYTIDSEGNIVVDRYQHRTINGTNEVRFANALIVYNIAGKGTGTNKWGSEVAIVDGIAQSDPVQSVGNMIVPKGGYVLSGHGASSSWILDNIKKGTRVYMGKGYVRIGG